MESGVKGTVRKFVDTKLEEAVCIVEDRAAVQRDLDMLEKWVHRFIKWLWVEGTSGRHLVQPTCRAT